MYRLVAETTHPLQRRVALEEYRTYDEALAAFQAAEAAKAAYPLVKHYAVRSAADPQWGSLRLDQGRDLWDYRAAGAAVREFVHRELGATALAFVKTAEAGAWLHAVEQGVLASMKDRGFEVTRLQVSDAVKARVMLGRCRPETHRWASGYRCSTWSQPSRQGHWWPVKEGRVADHHCPACNRQLGQSSLAFGGGFSRLLPVAAAVPA